MEFTEEMLARVFVPGKGMPIYLDKRPAELEDPAQQLLEHQWQPACGATSKLARCLEAVRDISTIVAALAATKQPAVEKRLLKQVITPIYNFATSLRDLYNYVKSNKWPELAKDRKRRIDKRFAEFTSAVPTKDGALKTARDKIAAHLDKDVFATEYRQFWELFEIADVIRWVRECVLMLDAFLRPDIYSWTRDSGYSNVCNLMSFDGREVSLLMKQGEPEMIVGLRLVTSPKAASVREVHELAAGCIALQQRLGSAQT